MDGSNESAAKRDPSRLRTRKLAARCHSADVSRTSQAALTVLLMLQAHENENRVARPSQDLLCVECGDKDHKTVRTALRALAAAGIITPVERPKAGGGKFTEYTIVDTDRDANPDDVFHEIVRSRQARGNRSPIVSAPMAEATTTREPFPRAPGNHSPVAPGNDSPVGVLGTGEPLPHARGNHSRGTGEPFPQKNAGKNAVEERTLFAETVKPVPAAVVAIADAIRQSAKLGPITAKPDEIAATLAETYPAVDGSMAVREANAWLVAHPERAKKKGAPFLLNWFKNAAKTGDCSVVAIAARPGPVKAIAPVSPEFATGTNAGRLGRCAQ